MSTKKHNDFNNIGSIYGDMLSGVKREIVKEDKIKEGEIGDAPLEKKGGPKKADGFSEPKIDRRKRKKGENLYNIDKLSYPDDLEEDEEDFDEEDEENDKESEKIAQESLNNFMKKRKSMFDRLCERVIVPENFGPPQPGNEMEDEDLDALGLDTDGGGKDDFDLDDEGGDEITLTLPRDVAQQLCNVLSAACGGGEEDLLDDELEGGDDLESDNEFDEMPEEDEEGFDSGSSMNTSYNDGKNNKVGSLKTSGKGQAKARAFNYKQELGANLSDKYNDGKNNKVGSLKSGHGAFEH